MLKLSVVTVLVGMMLGACGSNHHRAPAPTPTLPPTHFVITKTTKPLDPAVVFLACANVMGQTNRPRDCVAPSGVDLQGLLWQDWGTGVATAYATVQVASGTTHVYVDASRIRRGCHGGYRYTRLTVSNGQHSHVEHLPGC
jgi:hypothetical protein